MISFLFGCKDTTFFGNKSKKCQKIDRKLIRKCKNVLNPNPYKAFPLHQ